MVSDGGLASELEAGIKLELLGPELSPEPEAGVVLGGGLAGELAAGIELELPAPELSPEPEAGVELGAGLAGELAAGIELELLGVESSPEGGVELGGELAGELEAGIEPGLLGTESPPEAGVVLGGGLAGELEAGIGLELLGTELSPEADVVLGRGLAGELEAGIELELVFCGVLDTGTGFPEPDTQFGSRSDVASAGPSLIATQPGRYGMGPWTFSEGIGLGAAHEFITASGTKRFSLANTGQSWITPESSVQVSIARESVVLFAHPSMKSPCSP